VKKVRTEVLIEHRGRSPQVDPTAYVAPTAVLCGDVHVGPDARILFGAVLTAEDGSVQVGARCVVMENALVRGRAGHPTVLGDDVLVGPHAHVNGATVGDGCFLATGAAVFPGARLGDGVEVRIHAVVQVNTVLRAEAVVPIGWVAVGDPAQVLPPDRHDDIWAVQKGLDFVGTVYGLPRAASARERMERQSAWFGAHRDDRPVPSGQARRSPVQDHGPGWSGPMFRSR
jgi:carbonic anhydrase/acetyltransferase-like protein (isoleucine patch superfamily)